MFTLIVVFYVVNTDATVQYTKEYATAAKCYDAMLRHEYPLPNVHWYLADAKCEQK